MVDTEDPQQLLDTFSQAAREARSGIAERLVDVAGGATQEPLQPIADDDRMRELSRRSTRRSWVYSGTQLGALGRRKYKWICAPYAKSDQRYVLCNYRGELTHAGTSGVSFGSVASTVAQARAAPVTGRPPPYMTLDEYLAMRIDAFSRVFHNTDRENSLLLMQIMTDLFMEPRNAEGKLPGIDLEDPLLVSPSGETELNLFRYHIARRRLHLPEAKEDTITPVYPVNWQAYSHALPTRLWGDSATYIDSDARRQERPFVRVLPLWAINRHESADAVVDPLQIAARGIFSEDGADVTAYASRTMPMAILMFEWHVAETCGRPLVRLPKELAAVFTELGYTIYEMPKIMGRQVNAAATIPDLTPNDAIIAYYLVDCGLDAAHHRALTPICLKMLPGEIGGETPEQCKPQELRKPHAHRQATDVGAAHA